jgi:hypothetical protein
MTLARTRSGFFEDGSFRTRAAASAKRLPLSGPKPPPDPAGSGPSPVGRSPVGPLDSPEAWEERPSPLPGLTVWSSRPHRFGPANSSSSATLPRLATDRLHRLFARHSMPSWSQADRRSP